ncbi:uncharacterized protein LOC123874008 [Maniola jurtina]|uniref:uncharacterized protein LOC123874008 n=1 Tax=Maniola jurtina TaxID=191418 RepID=UPI001E68DB96|nr:uncharacterized protein LOC123874008 [Maniola jurtina]
MQQLVEKVQEYKQPLYIAFIDFTKAFDSIEHCYLWQALERDGCSTSISLENDILETVDSFTYLGKTISFKSSTQGDELNKRISNAWKRWTRESTVWCPRYIARRRGRPRTRWRAELEEFDGLGVLWTRLVADRDYWKKRGEAFARIWDDL